MKITLNEQNSVNALKANSADNNKSPIAVVGIGSSAGGLESLKAFFSQMHEDSDFTFIVIQHLPVEFVSTLDNILSRYTEIPIIKLSHNTRLASNTIYITPADKKAQIKGAAIDLTAWSEDEHITKKPIDVLFSSIAESYKEQAAGIILSGAGSDGTKGLEAIHRVGGCAMVERSASAQFDGMPNSALARLSHQPSTTSSNTGTDKASPGSETLQDVNPDASTELSQNLTSAQSSNARDEVGEITGLALNATDIALAPYEMPEVLMKHYNAHQQCTDKKGSSADNISTHQAILQFLKERFQLDFNHYKEGTIARRLDKRLQSLKIEHLEDYYLLLVEDEAEAEILYYSFLIGVTEFFRDAEVFAFLEESVIPKLLQHKSKGEVVRCWVAGCATGEEAYSIAILLDEACQKMTHPPSFKIFATDVHKPSIGTASQGVYSSASLDKLSATRKNRYFKQFGNDYKIIPDLRTKLVFAAQNMIADPPFTQIDLVSCRNVLIYFTPLAQKKILSSFHFSMNQEGILLLGPSEKLGGLSKHYIAVNERWNLFKRKPGSHISPSIRLLDKDPSGADMLNPETTKLLTNQHYRSSDLKLSRSMERLLDTHYGQSILVDENLQLVQSFGDCGHFLRTSTGRTSLNILELVQPELRAPLSSALHRAITKKERSIFEDIHFAKGKVTIMADPLAKERNESFYVSVHFTEEATYEQPEEPEHVDNTERDETIYQSLRDELTNTREHLQATIEEFEASNEELQATNEELLTSNEELQSTNEELHSVNEELFTVNSEYESKNQELLALNSDINNLLQSTEIGTVFLDLQLRIRKFTPTAAQSLNLIVEDLGRPIAHISHNFIDYPHFAHDIDTVAHNGQIIEKEVRSKEAKTYLLRILPYQETNQEWQGVVLTFVDVTALKHAEASVSEHQSRLDLAEELANLGRWNWDLAANRIYTHERFRQVTGLPVEDVCSTSAFSELLTQYGEKDALVNLQGKFAASDTINHTWTINLPDGTQRFLKGHGIVAKDVSDFPLHYRGVITDETEFVKQQQVVLQQKKDLETLLYVISHDLREPLRAIRNFSQFLCEDHIDPDNVKGLDYLSRIIRGSERMEALLHEVLTLSRVQRMGEPVEAVAGNELVEQALHSLEDRIEQTGASVTVANDLPILRVNRTWAKQAIFNLLANALKFVNPGQVPDVLVSRYVPPTPNSRHVGIVVQDRGPGIPEESVERVFKLFQRAVGNKVEGTGAGLAIVKEVASRHGGKVFYEPHKGGGSKFTITFLK